MTNYTHMNSINVQGSIESLTQGKLVGSFDTMPAATALNSGQIVLYTGPTGTYTKGKFYVSNGTSWVLSDASPSSITIDSALSSTSTNPVQNKVIQAALNGKLGTTETAAKATADASGNNIINTYATKTELTNGLAGKQNALTFDSAPTENSTNPVTSGGVYSAINTVQSAVASKQDQLTFDSTPTENSQNPVTSGGVFSAINNAGSSIVEETWGTIDISRTSFRISGLPPSTPSNYSSGNGGYYSLTLSDGSPTTHNGLYFDADSMKFKNVFVRPFNVSISSKISAGRKYYYERYDLTNYFTSMASKIGDIFLGTSVGAYQPSTRTIDSSYSGSLSFAFADTSKRFYMYCSATLTNGVVTTEPTSDSLSVVYDTSSEMPTSLNLELVSDYPSDSTRYIPIPIYGRGPNYTKIATE